VQAQSHGNRHQSSSGGNLMSARPAQTRPRPSHPGACAPIISSLFLRKSWTPLSGAATPPEARCWRKARPLGRSSMARRTPNLSRFSSVNSGQARRCSAPANKSSKGAKKLSEKVKPAWRIRGMQGMKIFAQNSRPSASTIARKPASIFVWREFDVRAARANPASPKSSWCLCAYH